MRGWYLELTNFVYCGKGVKMNSQKKKNLGKNVEEGSEGEEVGMLRRG